MGARQYSVSAGLAKFYYQIFKQITPQESLEDQIHIENSPLSHYFNLFYVDIMQNLPNYQFKTLDDLSELALPLLKTTNSLLKKFQTGALKAKVFTPFGNFDMFLHMVTNVLNSFNLEETLLNFL